MTKDLRQKVEQVVTDPNKSFLSPDKTAELARIKEQNLASMPAVVTSDAARKQTNDNLAQLDSILAPKDTQDKAPSYPPQVPNPVPTPKPNLEKQTGIDLPKASDATISAAETGLADVSKQMDTLRSKMDQRSVDQIDAIKADYAALIEDQKKLNQAYEAGTFTSGIRSGRERYAHEIQLGIYKGAVDQGLKKIATLVAKKNRAIAQAQDARDAASYKELARAMDTYRATIKEERDAAQQMFENTLALGSEARARAKAAREERDSIFDTQVSYAEQLAPTMVKAFDELGPTADLTDYVRKVAIDANIDPNILLGQISKIQENRATEEKKVVSKLVTAYPDAGITPEDTFESASDKVRKSKKYKLDILKAERTIANLDSQISYRALESKDKGPNGVSIWDDPVLGIYTSATGAVVDSPSQAKGIINYAENVLAGLDIVPDDFKGELADNQIRVSDAQKKLQSAFSKTIVSGGQAVEKKTIWQWLATPEGQEADEKAKAQYIRRSGYNPEDFGVYDL